MTLKKAGILLLSGFLGIVLASFPYILLAFSGPRGLELYRQIPPIVITGANLFLFVIITGRLYSYLVEKFTSQSERMLRVLKWKRKWMSLEDITAALGNQQPSEADRKAIDQLVRRGKVSFKRSAEDPKRRIYSDYSIQHLLKE